MADRRSRDEDEDRRGRRDRDDDRGSSRRERDDDRGERRSSRDDDDRGGSRRSSRDDDDRGSRGGSSYQYERRDSEKTRERASKGNNDYDRFLKDGIKVWKPNDGDNRIRILPPTWGPKTGHEKPDHHGFDIYVHYGVGADRQSYLCRHKMLSKPDPIYEAYLEAKNEYMEDDKNEDLKKLVKDLEAKRRVLVWLVDRDHEKEGVQAWAMPWTVDRDIVQVMTDKQTGEVLPIDDPEEGYDVEFTKKGAKDRTEYTGVAIARRSSPLGKAAFLDYAVDNPLPKQLVYFDYDHIAKAFGGKSVSRRDDDRDERRPSRDRDEERGSSREKDRDEERGGRDRDRDERRPSREDDDRGSRREEKPKGPTWASIHDMTKSELLDLIEDEKLDINPRDAKNTEDLADWVCEEMKIKEVKDEGGGRRRAGSDDEGAERMRAMRERRERD